MKISDESIDKWNAHCLDVYPLETCGIIKGNEIVIVDNTSDNPENSFSIDPKDIKKHKPDGIIHSHPYDVNIARKRRIDRRMPSKADMQAYINLGLDKGFGIVACDGMNVSIPLWLDEKEPLIGRKFLYNHNDCYTLLQQWMRENKNVELPTIATEFEWWYDEKPVSPYIELYESSGFKQIDARDIDIGDVSLMAIDCPVANHCAIYVENNQILHHLYGQQSTIQSYNNFKDYEVKVLRFVGNSNE